MRDAPLMRDAPIMRDALAVILGGGAGTRLFPLTRDRSKPAVPLAGKYRLIDIPISNCINSGLERIFVLTQYLSASLNRHVGAAYRFDRFRRGFITVLAAEQTAENRNWYQGTADAVRQSMSHLRAYPHEHVLILSGDQLYLMDYRKMIRHHLENEAQITIATIPVTAEDAGAFGILQTDDAGCITHFHEKPQGGELDGLESPVSEEMQRQGRRYLASMGIYLFDRDELARALGRDAGAHDFGKQIIPEAIGACRVSSYAFEDYWSDIGTIGSFYEANLALARPYPSFNLFDPERPVYTNARMLPPAKVQGCEIRDCMIAEGAVVVGSHLEESVIGVRSYIAEGSTVRRTVMLGADYFSWHEGRHYQPFAPDHHGIGAGSTVERAIIDKNVRIGTNCEITNRDGVEEGEGDFYYIRDGIVVLPKNTVVPDGTVL